MTRGGCRRALGGRENPLGRLDAVHHRHPDVHQDDVGCSRAASSTALGAVARLADELEVRLGGDQHPDPGAEQGLVVDEGDADLPCSPDSAGTDARDSHAAPSTARRSA